MQVSWLVLTQSLWFDEKKFVCVIHFDTFFLCEMKSVWNWKDRIWVHGKNGRIEKFCGIMLQNCSRGWRRRWKISFNNSIYSGKWFFFTKTKEFVIDDTYLVYQTITFSNCIFGDRLWVTKSLGTKYSAQNLGNPNTQS